MNLGDHRPSDTFVTEIECNGEATDVEADLPMEIAIFTEDKEYEEDAGPI